MARKLFEFRATRVRSGGLATGIAYVVYTDAAGTILADISTSSGGSSIAGSTVTTADIAGLGPSAGRFYGPTDDTDTLYVRCPSDTSLGVQRVEASTDARLDALEAGGGGSVAAHSADTTAIHGIADTAQLARKLQVSDAGLWVSPAGLDTNDGLSPGAAKLTLTAAAATIPDTPRGGVINVLGGAHAQTITVTPKSNTFFKGFGNVSNAGPPSPPVRIQGPAMTTPLFDISNTSGVHFQGLTFSGNNAAGMKGIYASTCADPTIRDCLFDNFGDQAIHSEGGVLFTIDHIFVQNSLLVGGRSAYVGAVDIANTDAFLVKVNSTTSASAVSTGWRVAIAVRGANSFVTNSVGQISEAGFYISAPYSRFIGCRADLNRGHGYVVAGAVNEFVGNLAFRNGLDTDNTYDGFMVAAGQNNFVANRIDGLAADANQQRYGFNDSTSAGATYEIGNSYHANRSRYIRGSLYNITGSSPHGVAGLLGPDFVIRQGGLSVGGNPSMGSGAGGIVFIANAGAVPSTNPSGGGVVYVEGGALKYRGSSGTVTVIGPA